MKQAAYDEMVAAREEKAAWPTEEQARAYLITKGFDEKQPGVWALPAPDHAPTAKQAACLDVLSAKTVKAHVLRTEPGVIG